MPINLLNGNTYEKRFLKEVVYTDIIFNGQILKNYG